jgi:hypothetical protein
MHSTGHPEADAWHEAGHAVVARLLGGRVRWVTLETEEEHEQGRAAIEWRPRDARELASLSARAALGGPLAELVHRGEDGLEDPSVLAAWAADEQEVERAATELEPDPEKRVALIRSWLEEVRALVTDPVVEERIARVADALDAHGTLDEDLFEDCLA